VHKELPICLQQLLVLHLLLVLLLLLLLQARSLKDALVAMDRTISNIKDFAAWYSKYPFITPGAQRRMFLFKTAHQDRQAVCRVMSAVAPLSHEDPPSYPMTPTPTHPSPTGGLEAWQRVLRYEGFETDV
jgi:hypothetical protein